LYNQDDLDNQSLDQLYRTIVTDLVTLAIKANDVVIQGSFAGSISDEVNALLKMCKEIEAEYVIREDKHVE